MSARNAERAVRARLWSGLDMGLCGAGLWLAGPLPVARVGGLYDDYLFVRLANFLLQGRWLGPYDALTLAKGPFYPMFLAASAALGMPVQVATELVYLAGALALSRCAGGLAGRRGVATAALALLVFNPACFEWSTTTLMREPLYCGLTLLVLGLAGRVFLAGGGVASALALGAAGAAFWLTREEGPVMALPLAPMAAWSCRADIAACAAGLRGRAWTRPRQVWRVLVPAATAACLVAVVWALNWHAYGVFRGNDFQAGPYPRAYGALARIVPDHLQLLTPISRDMRLRAYAASPAFQELRPYLEGDSAHLATDVACRAETRAYCHDIPGASFMWAFRDAVARAGHYETARDADRFYRRLAREIDAACARGALPCIGPRTGFLPPLVPAYAAPVLHSLGAALAQIVRLGGASPTIIFSPLQGPLAPAYDTLTAGTRISPQQRLAFAQGWQVTGALAARDPKTRLSVATPPGGAVQADIQTTPDPGAPGALHRQAGSGTDFGADLRCAPALCRLTVEDDGRVLGGWAMAGLRPGIVLDTAEATLEIVSVSPLASYAALEAMPDLRRAVMGALCRVWPVLSIVGTPLAAIALLIRLASAWRARRLDALTVLGACLLLTVASRALLLALLDATTTSLQFRYESPAMGPLLCFVAAMLGPALSDSTRALRRARSRAGSP